ncbi:hypothetical protein [Priestia taiwanensis]|uniref:LysM domain-containing protein n=1 Tax=Priestia taiwanensis TaxID=1347902 RepID=A0A917AVS7_9BACI|nr:hypothetical protein [Priestia taiwanensis]MBM7363784.1 hypothetical protein [Priestia taiwanensis]GGE74104.1 hypothetical protein GCM10007140_25020 [Priestia taiwanensis]
MVKKLVFLISILMLGYIIFYDIKVGTLSLTTPSSHVSPEEKSVQTSTTTKKQTQPTIPYREIEVKSGDTLLTILEQLHNNRKLPPIKQITDDFKTLNTSISPTKLTIGKTYKFPIYE